MCWEVQAGVSRCDITPPVGIAHANWGAQSHERAVDVELPLTATALALGDENPAVLIDVDLLYLVPEDAARIRSRAAALAGVPETHVRLAYSHTHSGPTVRRDTWADQGADMIEPYIEQLANDIAGIAWHAVRNRVPAILDAGSATCDIGINRRFHRPEDGSVIVGRNPDGPVDHEALVLRIDELECAPAGDEETHPLATVVTYACHPITVGPDNQRITPDYPGVTRRTVENATGSTCLFLQGAAGDVGPVRGVAQGGIDEFTQLGRRLGHAASQTWWQLDPTGREDRYVETVASGAPLALYEPTYPNREQRSVTVHSTEVELPVRDLPSASEAKREFETRTEELESLRESAASAEEIAPAITAARQAEIQAGIAERFGDQRHESFEIHLVSLGEDVVLIGVPGEPFVEIQRRVKEESPFECTFFSGYSNVGTGYIPTADAYEHGGYEVNVTPFSPDAAETVVDATTAALDEVYPE